LRLSGRTGTADSILFVKATGGGGLLGFGNVVKAQVTQTVLAAILERWGYRVSRLGVEELFGEIKYLDDTQYHALGLPKQLRTLPDLLSRWQKVL
jgi:hypothetical protein